ncbi:MULTISPECIES: SDR family NAD(P)-dependent oxidoreductase [unclassified Pantoea]|uniref:SDR family NAD(P)-dependent oxidoreductase n=1 Tax=unclassified Pantoea TaxID=2630326 RepID=UPI001CD2A04F|nr:MULTISPECIES: SDR family NAD(P)-dependent oxidoreductase [unclassified Pantoea]MCA1179588.1 SDR family NAD(P)-dependent oxidoreductase [Pantoea sp. alder69]MCA1251841.1 SDR family NAD(P)-dependent oxidoreductase [Pantoea sp. alder70]MCA1267822.1 SDR family NAD(P)-dependent oxidoreductase [Pantoea sp. alder81]
MNRKTALITGASNGIGYELAKIFAKNGYNIIAVSRGEEKLNKACEELRKSGTEIFSYPADLSNYDDIESLKKRIDSESLSINAMVINAGQGLGGRFIGGTELSKELNLIRLNIDSYVHLSKVFLPELIKNGGGHVLMTSSVSGTSPIPFEAIYGASKAFVNSFFWAIRNELKGQGLNMTLLMPGATQTNFFNNAGQANTKVGASQPTTPEEVAERAWYALMSGHEYVYGSDDAEHEGDILNRIQSESQKAQRHRLISEPDSAGQ